MLIIDETDQDAQCFVKAKQRGQRTFTLVEQDVTAVPVIAEWIKQNIAMAPPEKLRKALENYIAMRDFKTKKFAD